MDPQPSIPWLTYAGGPGGQPLGDPPASVPFGGPSARCAGRRSVRIGLPRLGRTRVRRTEVFVGGRRIQVLRGRHARGPVVLRGLAPGLVSVRIVMRPTRGHRIVIRRRYRIC